MYWSRTGSIADIVFYLLLCTGWWIGGWFIVTYIFHQRVSERLITGFAAGLLFFIALSNLFAHVLPLPAAFWSASGLIFLGGVGLAIGWTMRRQPGGRLRFILSELSAPLRSWPQIASLLGLTLLFELIGRGLAIFDDYLHIPLVSVMAAGDIPPHFYLDPTKYFSYHYGLQVLAASLVRMAGFFPWSAWDLSKALAIALTMMLAWVWIRRVTRSERAAYLGSFLVTFASGARWLLLLVPIPILLRLTTGIHPINTGADTAPDFYTVLSQPWAAEGSGPFPFPFAFHNGIFLPIIFALGSSGAMPFFTVIELLLLAKGRRFSVIGSILIGLIFATLALSAEHLFVLLWIGIALAGGIGMLRNRLRGKSAPRDLLISWGIILFTSGMLSVVQGAYITEAVRNLLLRFQGTTAAAQSKFTYFNFGFRWPPVLDSAHFSPLSPFNPGQLLVILAELGPALLLALPVSLYVWHHLRKRDWLTTGLGIAAVLSLLMAFFVRYGIERSSTRLPWTALWIWVLLGFPILWKVFQKAGRVLRTWIRLGYGVTVFSGIVIFAVQLTAIPAPQLTYFANSNDARISSEMWNRLPEGAQVLDRIQYRAVALFGRAARSYSDVYTSLPEWDALIKDPNPASIAQAGYSYIYIDAKWWWEMTQEQRDGFNQPCVKKVAEINPSDEDYRWLLAVHACK
jgi:hypothetical protein